jgi:DNA ligase (NAD+)
MNNLIYLEIPKKCPYCSADLIIKQDNNSKILFCPNKQCEGRLLNKLDHFCGKKGLDIKGLSKATLEKLMNWGWINNIKDIFMLFTHKEEWIKKPGFGEASVQKILSAIDEASETTLDKIIAAADIPLVGTRLAKDIAEWYDNSSWVAFREDIENHYDFTQKEGIGEILKNNILNFNYEDIDYIVEHYLDIKSNNNQNENINSLEGKTFCITGSLKLYKNRAELIADIESRGRPRSFFNEFKS